MHWLDCAGQGILAVMCLTSTCIRRSAYPMEGVGPEWDQLACKWAQSGTIWMLSGLGMGPIGMQVGLEWDQLACKWAWNGTNGHKV